MPWPLAMGFLVDVLTAATFFSIALLLHRRHVRGDLRGAMTMFTVWWWCVGFQQAIAATRIVLWTGDLPLSLHVGLSLASAAALVTGLAALLSYLLYLFTGRDVLWWPLVVLYGLYFGWYVTLIAGFEPIAVESGGWGVSYVYAAPPSDALVLSFLGFLVGPQLVAGLALVVLAMRLPPSVARLRMTVVAAGVLLWFGSALITPATGFEGPGWGLVRSIIPLLVGVSVLLVYRLTGSTSPRHTPDRPPSLHTPDAG
jgi:hypothetical protein